MRHYPQKHMSFDPLASAGGAGEGGFYAYLRCFRSSYVYLRCSRLLCLPKVVLGGADFMHMCGASALFDHLEWSPEEQILCIFAVLPLTLGTRRWLCRADFMHICGASARFEHSEMTLQSRCYAYYCSTLHRRIAQTSRQQIVCLFTVVMPFYIVLHRPQTADFVNMYSSCATFHYNIAQTLESRLYAYLL